jgi:hypothetical protein
LGSIGIESRKRPLEKEVVLHENPVEGERATLEAVTSGLLKTIQSEKT